VTEGDRVAQLILERIVTPEVTEVEVRSLPPSLSLVLTTHTWCRVCQKPSEGREDSDLQARTNLAMREYGSIISIPFQLTSSYLRVYLPSLQRDWFTAQIWGMACPSAR
jgi:hypothetical protein